MKILKLINIIPIGQFDLYDLIMLNERRVIIATCNFLFSLDIHEIKVNVIKIKANDNGIIQIVKVLIIQLLL